MTGDWSQTSPLLEARDLSVGYDGVALVSHVDLAVQAGEVVTLVGPNGVGKSTILKTLSGHLKPIAGEVSLLGANAQTLPTQERAKLMAVLLTDRIGTSFMTCEDVVEMGRYPHTGRLGILDADDRAKVREAMELLDVADLATSDFMRISDGQRQRVMLARAVCQEPRVMVLDEPTSHLDIRYQLELLAILRHLATEREMGIVMSLHEVPLACKASDWLVCVKGDAVVAQGAPTDVAKPKVIDALFDLVPGTFDPLHGVIALPRLDSFGRSKKGRDDAEA